MKALRKQAAGPGNMGLCDIPEPAVSGEDDVKIAVRACGICGTDLHIRAGGYGFNPPVTMGHEICGEVVATGRRVDHLQPGQRVTVNPTASGSCGTCADCRRGAYYFCPQRRSIGSRMDGGFAEYLVASKDLVFELPDSVPDEAGALVEPFACCVKAVNRLTTIGANDLVLISGPGPIGLMCAFLAVGSGARVVVAGTGADRERLEAARSLGAEAALEVESADVTQSVLDLTEGRGAAAAFDCAGARGSIELCIKAVASGGQITQVALVDHPIEVDWGRIIYKELRVRGAIATDWPSWNQALDRVRQGKVDLSRFVTHTHRLDAWEEGFRNAEGKQGLKQILKP